MVHPYVYQVFKTLRFNERSVSFFLPRLRSTEDRTCLHVDFFEVWMSGSTLVTCGIPFACERQYSSQAKQQLSLYFLLKLCQVMNELDRMKLKAQVY